MGDKVKDRGEGLVFPTQERHYCRAKEGLRQNLETICGRATVQATLKRTEEVINDLEQVHTFKSMRMTGRSLGQIFNVKAGHLPVSPALSSDT